jgi:hypothetical protein
MTIPKIHLPMAATMDGKPVTLWPGFDGYVRFTPRGKVVASCIVHHTCNIVFDEYPDMVFSLNRERGNWVRVA